MHMGYKIPPRVANCNSRIPVKTAGEESLIKHYNAI